MALGIFSVLGTYVGFLLRAPYYVGGGYAVWRCGVSALWVRMRVRGALCSLIGRRSWWGVFCRGDIYLRSGAALFPLFFLFYLHLHRLCLLLCLLLLRIYPSYFAVFLRFLFLLITSTGTFGVFFSLSLIYISYIIYIIYPLSTNQSGSCLPQAVIWTLLSEHCSTTRLARRHRPPFR